jgi:hypothetical protein
MHAALQAHEAEIARSGRFDPVWPLVEPAEDRPAPTA